MRMKLEAIRHPNDIRIAILQSGDDITEIEERPQHAVIRQQERGMQLVLRIFFQRCFPSIKIISSIFPTHYSYAVSRQFLEICIPNSFAGADEYDVKPGEL